ncbi:MAG: ankyrin repeat domain-containing protein [Polyangiaceae bacterium]
MPDRAAIAVAESRFAAVAERFNNVYGMRLPRHVIYAAAFILGLDPAERAKAWQLEGAALFGVGEWFKPDGPGRTAWIDERCHGRYRRDPPEFVSFISGNSDGSHWGLFYDDPAELPRVVAHNWARDDADTRPAEPTLLASMAARVESTGESVPPALERWLAELIGREREAHRKENIGEPLDRADGCVGGMGPAGVELPPDWVGDKAAAERLLAYRADAPVVHTWIERARRELANGAPGLALWLGRELHWTDVDRYRAASTELLVGGYRALGREALARVVEVHHANRDMPTVDVYSRTSSPFYLAAFRGDAALVEKLVSDPSVDSELIEIAARATKSDAVRDILVARDVRALDAVVSEALRRASPAGNTKPEEQAHWQRQAEALVERSIAAHGRVEPACVPLVFYGPASRARELLERADPHWVDPRGQTLLHIAAGAASTELVAFLLARGASPDVKDDQQRTPADRARAMSRGARAAAANQVLEMLSSGGKSGEPLPLGPGARVRHAKFGDGVVVSTTDDKLTVQFADGARTLQSRFVTRL